MKTAVEWLVEQLNEKIDFIPLDKWDMIRDIVLQAKEMEKEQIIDFADDYGTYLLQGGQMSATTYKETFKSEYNESNN